MAPGEKIRDPSEDETPMMQQYQRIKRECSDALLFFRMGDFYEMFNEDARIASRILEIALTSRSKNKANSIPMCGVPHHAANAYISKLIKAGKKVALCEQTEDPKLAKGLVRREIVRIVTPGTVLDDALLDPKSNHFVVSLFFGKDGLGLAALDISTGLFKVTEINGDNTSSFLADELEKIDPREILVPESRAGETNGSMPWSGNENIYAHSGEDWTFSFGEAYRKLLEHFKTGSLEGFGCEHLKLAISAAGALIHYLHETQKSALQHITALSTYHIENSMLLDQTTIKSLELIQASDGSRKNSLLDLLETTQTPMGARRVKEWILKPLIDREAIEERLSQVHAFVENPLLRKDMREQLQKIHDLERLVGRISLSMSSPRDLMALKNSIETFPSILALLSRFPAEAVSQYAETWDNLEDVFRLIDEKIVDEPPATLKDGHLIKPGCDQELDRLKSISKDGKTWIAALETKEKERTGIPVLKVGYNKIYGYYIEITKKNIDRVPAEYIRKQSLVNAERYISPELKEYEVEITGAEEKITELEFQLFQKIREDISREGPRIQTMARTIAKIDALFSFAETAHQYNYCRPTLLEDPTLCLKNGRHPLVEKIDPLNQFIPNDTVLDSTDNQIMIITGPNMAGKSTFLRQVALITLMAQIGSFVPADEARIGVVDRIFSRVGAQDHLLKGQSTFMVEMNEAANILNNATARSLIILDEIGRGTSTFDGISIAWSIVEYLHALNGEQGGPKTLFATHYHELTDLALVLPGVNNFNVQVKEWNDEIIFLRKIVSGGADKSYGIQVARLAGLPEKVLKRALEVLDNLEKSEFDESGRPKISHSEEAPANLGPQQLTMFGEDFSPLLKKLDDLNPDDLTPRQALDLLFEFKDLRKKPKM
ncbi:MAG: DNA mismatch repair protein MutS [Nitrospinaceae bacterium]|nr:MAG: DNA mismatch repair protein MutS [Nitrospinaceae bacterium]